ncbi:hypothetical protein NHX12_001564 [Muraenolepis orangiensis]|uniref:Receptor ligand binding region domain-containing protein n=1 Tax=Muraenolepis orangiensis TaxID=630683 RepID=A0A9Q0DZY0_9TELE|nr:hypothetical protein NHX12_001564 [Muraenolepis orangiensis]
MVQWKDNPRRMLVLMVLLLVLLLGSQWVQGRSSARGSRHLGRGQRDLQPLQEIRLAIILPQINTVYPWAWPRVGPAVERAIQTINADSALLPNHRLTYSFKNSENKDGICCESLSALAAMDFKYLYDPWVFIGPGCSYASSPVGSYTSLWSIPMVTAGASAVAFSNLPSITNTGPTHKKLGKFVLRVCEKFGWQNQVMLLFNDNKVDDRPCYFAIEGLYTELDNATFLVQERVFRENQPPLNYSEIISDIQQLGRVVFTCCSPDVFRKIMVKFRQAGLAMEEYVFLFIDVFGESLINNHRQPWARGDSDDHIAMEAYQVTMASWRSL